MPGAGTTAAYNGSYLNVFNNDSIDGSFGITAPIILQQLTRTGTLVSSLNVTALAAASGFNLTTSFSSKSELAVNLSTTGTSLTFMGYNAPVNKLDVSNANTPGITEPGNYTQNAAYRVVAQINADGSLSVTTTNAYPGNNPRASIYDVKDNQYLTVGNAGNANGSAQVTAANGVQSITPGSTPGTPGTTKVGSFSVNQINPATGQPYSTTTKDKTSKDDNYRGETIFNNTLYVTKGSGSNGIDSVYQVGTAGTLPTGTNNPINILPGFPTNLAKNATYHPFGIFFANADTLYVADEGMQNFGDTKTTNPYAGLEKWSLVGGTWKLDYTLTNGLDLDTPYSTTDPGYIGGINTAAGEAYDPATDGLRNITGLVNANGTVTIYAVTSTVSGSGDQGADPNKLVAITDDLSDTSLPNTEAFTVLESATPGQVIRGVSLAPVPEPGTLALLASGALAGAGLLVKRRKR